MRCFDNGQRISTAVVLPGNHLLQVYPEKEEFESFDSWRSKWLLHSNGITFEETLADGTVLKVVTKSMLRLMKVLEEFNLPEFKTYFRLVEKLNGCTVRVTMHNGDVWILEQSLDFFAPPIVLKNGVYLNYEWTQMKPVMWLIMVAFTDPE